MRKHYKKILTGFVILILLVIAFLCGGDAPGLSNYTFKSKENINTKQVEEIKEKTRLRAEPLPFTAENGATKLSVQLHTNDVVLITLTQE